MATYTAYGLIIESDLEIPELALSHVAGREPDVRIRRAAVPAVADDGRDGSGCAYRLNSREMLYTRDHCGLFLVRDGLEIEVDPAPEAEDRVWRLSLFGPALGLLLIQRGFLVLHGGAVVCPGGAVLLLGPGGSGKSTLTAELCRRGGGLLTDDVVAIDMDGPVPRVLPGVPLLKLWPDAVDDAPAGAWTQVLHPDYEKVGRRLEDADLAGAAPVAGIFVLQGGPRVARETLSGVQAFRALMASLFAARYGDSFVAGLDGQDLLRKVARLLEHARVEVLQRPQDRAFLAETAKMILASLQPADTEQ
jgi:hypothetical protein